ncbi:MAG: hypothetical protein AAGL90_14345 [Pseudomonadota bacterium]
MKTIEISTVLNADPRIVCEHLERSELLRYVTKGVLKFKPIDPPEFPEVWQAGSYKASIYWKGFLPVGWQVIRIETQPMRGETWSLRDNGYGWLIKTWDHIIETTPHEEGCLYTDRIRIEADMLTPFVALFAGRFYRHRQKRWQRLVKNGFDYDL